MEAIAQRFGLDVEQTLDNVIVCRVFSHEEQIEIVKPIAALLSDADQGPFRTIIVDSIIALFRTEFHGRGDLSERQQKLGQHMSHLVRLSEEFNIAGMCLVCVWHVPGMWFLAHLGLISFCPLRSCDSEPVHG